MSEWTDSIDDAMATNVRKLTRSHECCQRAEARDDAPYCADCSKHYSPASGQQAEHAAPDGLLHPRVAPHASQETINKPS